MSDLKEIYCDLNARMTENGYSLERRGSVNDLERVGLTLELALGMKFRFYMDDLDKHGKPDDIMFEGIVIHDSEFGYLAKQQSEVFWRSDISDFENI
ncbi:hypothetical protein ACJJIG_14390 [Microbulbifer sp. SSSA007]